MKLHILAWVVTLFGSLTLLVASDHIDGPVTIYHPVGDLTDLFVFPSPDVPGHLTTIMNVYSGVAVDGHFSDKVTYSMLVRHARVRSAGQERGFETSGDYQISCTFETPHGPFASHWITCKSSKGTAVRQKVGDASGGPASDGLRVFAGRRSDPFFFNANWATTASTGGKLLPPSNSNIMQDVNALSIVLVINIEKELGISEGSLFAVAAETTTQDSISDPVRQLDRLGRPEITNVSMAAHDKMELRDLYNAEKNFNVSGKNFDLYRKRLRENVAYFDKLNGTIEWTSESANQLVEILLNDYQVVDVSKPCSANTYFEIERSILRGVPHSTCGGRIPNDDIMDILFTLLINGGNLPLLSDGVDRPTQLAKGVFPYLAEPNDGINTEVTSFLFRAVGKLTTSETRWMGILQLLSGITALIGTVMLLYYFVRLGVVHYAKREYAALKGARLFGIIGLLFGIASILCIITNAVSLAVVAVLVVIGIAARVWQNHIQVGYRRP